MPKYLPLECASCETRLPSMPLMAVRPIICMVLVLAAPSAAFMAAVRPTTSRMHRTMRSVTLSETLGYSSVGPLTALRPSKALSFVKGETKVIKIQCDADENGCYALCSDEDGCSIAAPVGLTQRLKVGFYFAAWFLLSVGYSITNKRVTNVLPCPWSVATATVVVGSMFVNLLWLTGVRKPPKLPRSAYLALLPIGTFHAIGHIAGTVGTAAGSVSFAQVVKAAGPVYACVLSATVLRQAVSLRVWGSLVPIILGVALATLKELSFAWAALLGAVASDLALALRNVLSKQSMGQMKTTDGEPLKPADMFGMLTCVSALVSIPAALAVEGSMLPSLWREASALTPGGSAGLAGQVALTGLYFYGYSEVAMKALNNVHPVTHAIGNTMRRVVIMLVCMVAFRTPMTPLGAVGSALAVGGSYVYAMVKTRETQRERQMAKEKDGVQEKDGEGVAVFDEEELELELELQERLIRALPLEVVPAETESPRDWLVWRGPRLAWSVPREKDGRA